MAVRLSCCDAVSTIDDVALDTLPVTIGRGEEADVRVFDTWASRIHCVLVERDGRLWIEDRRSSNGTRLNGEFIREAEVCSGDQLTVGITTFRVTFSRVPANQPAKESTGRFAHL
ncbi:MAG: FHA domain-containing protein [Planctomycetota bacterium]|jgi:pSer/pThr/pTyr-binding forkhead associated (FHA) protein